ncbi:hypothetical protein HDV62DRAFT_300539 [Trichoderma sp. SZMC 28011]
MAIEYVVLTAITCDGLCMAAKLGFAIQIRIVAAGLLLQWAFAALGMNGIYRIFQAQAGPRNASAYAQMGISADPEESNWLDGISTTSPGA